jgi:hypothetical protein
MMEPLASVSALARASNRLSRRAHTKLKKTDEADARRRKKEDESSSSSNIGRIPVDSVDDDSSVDSGQSERGASSSVQRRVRGGNICASVCSVTVRGSSCSCGRPASARRGTPCQRCARSVGAEVQCHDFAVKCVFVGGLEAIRRRFGRYRTDISAHVSLKKKRPFWAFLGVSDGHGRKNAHFYPWAFLGQKNGR